jgi:hypothetical protein
MSAALVDTSSINFEANWKFQAFHEIENLGTAFFLLRNLSVNLPPFAHDMPGCQSSLLP